MNFTENLQNIVKSAKEKSKKLEAERANFQIEWFGFKGKRQMIQGVFATAAKALSEEYTKAEHGLHNGGVYLKVTFRGYGHEIRFMPDFDRRVVDFTSFFESDETFSLFYLTAERVQLKVYQLVSALVRTRVNSLNGVGEDK